MVVPRDPLSGTAGLATFGSSRCLGFPFRGDDTGGTNLAGGCEVL